MRTEKQDGSTCSDGDISLALVLQKLDALIERAAVPKRFLSIAHAAEYADLSEDSVRRMIERGDLVAHRPVRGRILVDRQQLDQVILSSTNAPLNGRGMSARKRGGSGRFLKAPTGKIA